MSEARVEIVASVVRERLLSATDKASADHTARERYGIHAMQLMENAGQGVWRAIRSQTVTPGTLVCVAGSGNNGGDALVVARQASIEGEVAVRCVTVRTALSGLAGEQQAICRSLGIPMVPWDEDPDGAIEQLQSATWIVDGVFGTGLNGPARSPHRELIAAINDERNRRATPVWSIDLPSGARTGGTMGEETVIADVTVATGWPDASLFDPARRARCGRIVSVDPGFPRTVVDDLPTPAIYRWWYPRGDLRPLAEHPFAGLLPSPGRRSNPDTWKGARGRVAVVGGHATTAGAPILSALAAQMAGAGMVRLVAPRESCAAAAAIEPGIMSAQLDDDEELDRVVAWADAVVAGPGWIEVTAPLVERLISACERDRIPLVLDASALRALSGDDPVTRAARATLETGGGTVVLTPHIGELAALASCDISEAQSDICSLLAACCGRSGLTVVAKGATTHIRRDDGVIDVIDGREATMAVAGAGDVLAGTIAAYLAARHDAPVHASVRHAVLDHLAAGRRLARHHSSYSATQLARALGAGVLDG